MKKFIAYSIATLSLFGVAFIAFNSRYIIPAFISWLLCFAAINYIYYYDN